MRSILFVCSGNTCRSPMAEAIARHVASKHPFDSLKFSFASAGSSAIDDQPVTPEAAAAVTALGMAMHEHHSRSLTKELIASADAIYGLTPGHVAAITAIDPTAADRTDLLDPEGRAVPDPIGHPQQVYDETAHAIQRAVVDRLSEYLAATRQP